jgi:molybdopterin/thiamine biosynthesis adenylyltransferase/rhodanese-related sulfurtransferase
MSMLERHLQTLRDEIDEVDPPQAAREARTGARLIDIREEDEVLGGMPAGALRIARGRLEMELARLAATEDRVLLLCAGDVRSLLAAHAVQAMGFRNVASVRGGYDSWVRHGLPVAAPRLLSGEQKQRYARHLRIPEVGEAGQIKLLNSRVLLVGAGGLGSPAAMYLAAAGVGTVGLVDDDVVDRSNLQRQLLHTDARIGQKKVESARQTLTGINPSVKVEMHDARLSPENVERIFSNYDVIVDGTDNFTARYLINDACLRLGLPNVHGAIFRFEGYVTVFSKRHAGPCYRCWYPSPPPPEYAPSCAEAGVLGVLPGVIGTLQAVEVIKLLLDIGEPLVGRVLSYDALNAEFNEFDLHGDDACEGCGRHAQARALEEVAAVCATAPA